MAATVTLLSGNEIKQEMMLPPSEGSGPGSREDGATTHCVLDSEGRKDIDTPAGGSEHTLEHNHDGLLNGGNEQVNATNNECNDQDDSPVIDIHINNVVCTFNLRCHINLKRVAMEGSNVEYRREHGILNMKLRRPRVTANITSSGKVTCTGSTSEAEAKVAARRVARLLQKIGFNVRFSNYRVVNVLGTCILPFGIKLHSFSNQYPEEASYEPELHPGATYRIKPLKATLKIFSTGSITITAPCVANIGLAIEHIYPLVSEFQMEPRAEPNKQQFKHRRMQRPDFSRNGFHHEENNEEEEFDSDEDEEMYDSEFEESFDSDVSHD